MRSVQQQRYPMVATCSQGSNCSHWLVSSEFSGVNNMIDHQLHADFQANSQRSPLSYLMYDQPGSPTSSHKNSDLSCNWRRPINVGMADSGSKQALLKQQKLAVFNQLLAQQLMMLTYQQKQQQQQQQLQCRQAKFQPKSAKNDNNKVSSSSAMISHQQRQLLMFTQNNSTDSACDSLNSRQQQAFVHDPSMVGVLHAGNTMSSAGRGHHQALAGNTDLDLESCPSIAYKLMTAGSHHAAQGRGYHNERPAQLSSQGNKAELSRDSRRLGRGDKLIITKYKGRYYPVELKHIDWLRIGLIIAHGGFTLVLLLTFNYHLLSHTPTHSRMESQSTNGANSEFNDCLQHQLVPARMQDR